MKQTVFEFGRIQAPGDWLTFGAVFVLLLAAALLIYRRDARGQRPLVAGLLVLFRWTVYALILWVFLDPRFRTEVKTERPSRVLVLADASLSMTVADETTSESVQVPRADRVSGLFEQGDFLLHLRRRHDVAVNRFGRGVTDVVRLERNPGAGLADADSESPEQSIDWRAALAPNEDQSRLGEALADVLRRETSADSAGPVAAVVLLTDGKLNAGASVDPAIKLSQQAKIPIHAAGVGSDRQSVNIRIVDLEAPVRVYRGDVVQVTARVQASGVERRRIPIAFSMKSEQTNAAPKVIETKEVEIGGGPPASVTFFYRPTETGHFHLALRADAIKDELRSDDNVAEAAIEVVADKTKVMIVAGGPGWEYQFLRALLFRDKSVELSLLLQTAREAIDQDAERILREFPENRDELFTYDVIVAIDVDWNAVSEAGRNLLVEWVGEQAGGLIAVAGPINTPRLARDEALAPIRELYPVVLKEIFSTQLEGGGGSEAWPVAMTREGQASDFLRLETDPAQSLQRWNEFSGFFTAYPITSVRSGGTVLAEFSDPRARQSSIAPVVFASQYYGSGRIFYIGSAELWRLRRLAERYYDQLWIRLVRQLAQGRLLRGANRGDLLLEADRYSLGAIAPIRARLVDQQFQPLIAASVPLFVVDPKGGRQEIVLEAEAGQPGRFHGSLSLRQPGEHRLQLMIPGSDGVIERRINVVIPDLEFEDPRLDRPLLERIAKETGGNYVSIEAAASLADSIEDRTEMRWQSETPVPLWDKAWVMLAIIGLLSAEWLVRKLVLLG